MTMRRRRLYLPDQERKSRCRCTGARAKQVTDPIDGECLFHPRMDVASEGQTEEQAKPFAKTALQQRPESAGQCALGIPRKADMPQWQASRAETVQPRPLPRALASVAPRSHHGSTSGLTRRLCTQAGSVGAPPCDPTR